MSGMDEATLFQSVKYVEYGTGRVHPGVKDFAWKGRGLGHVTLSKIVNPFNIPEMAEATLFKFGKCVDYGKSHTREKIPPKGA